MPRRKPAKAPLWWRLMLPTAGILMMLLAFDAFSSWMKQQAGDDLRLYVEGDLRRIEPSEVEVLALRYLNTDLMSLDIEGIQRDIQALPWIERAVVRRRWPDGVRVQVWERKPVAQWGKASFVTAQGVRFTPTRMPGDLDLPKLDGPEGAERALLATLTAFASAIRPLHLEVDSVWISARGSWHVQLGGGQRLDLGRSHTEQRLSRFLSAVYPAVKNRMDNIEYIDLRYSNGFAVGWREPPLDDSVAQQPTQET